MKWQGYRKPRQIKTLEAMQPVRQRSARVPGRAAVKNSTSARDALASTGLTKCTLLFLFSVLLHFPTSSGETPHRSSIPPAPYDPPGAIAAPSYSTGAGATVTWFHDSAYSQPAYGSLEGQTIYGVLSQPATAAAFGTLANGTLTQVDPKHIKFTANSSILPCHTVQGLQTLPCDLIFFTRVDRLPLISQHWIGDGSGWCEDGGKYDRICQGDSAKGTGWYTAVGPAGSQCHTTAAGNPVYPGHPGAINGGGSPSGSSWRANYDCHVVFPSGGINFGGTTQATILDGTEPIDWTANQVYPSYGGPFPDVRFRFQEFRESGMYVTPSYNCNTKTGDVPNPPFVNCPTGGSQPFYPSSGGIDAHEYMQNPATFRTWEIYNDQRFGGVAHCQSGAYNCTIGSGRHIEWYDYNIPPSAIGAAGTPENQIELTVMDLAMAAIDPIAHPIQHAFALTEPLFTLARGDANSNRFVWPAQYFSGYANFNNMGAIEGERKRLDTSRVSLNGGLYSVTETSLGSGYPPGAVITGTVSGCSSIDQIHPASVIGFIGASGALEKNPYGNQVYLYINNTGTHCVNPQVSFPAPSGGTPITATLTVFNLSSFSQAEQNMIVALYNQATQYGMTVDDVGYASNETFRTEVQLANPSNALYAKAAYAFYGARANGFGNGMLWSWVDTSSLAPSGSGWPGMQSKSWMTSSSNALEGASVQNQNVVRLTTRAGVVSYNPIPTIGVGVGFNIPNLPNQLNIVAGTGPINLAHYAYTTGDSTSSGVTFSWISDPCPGSDTLTSAGNYTTCPKVSGIAPLTGQLRVASVANPGAFTLVAVTVLPAFDSSNMLSIDVAGAGGCANGTSWIAGKTCNGNGTVWSADCPSCFYFSSSAGAIADYPHWPWAQFGGRAAPQSVSGESAIYQSYTYGNPDLTMSVIVPNGNYVIRALVGSTNRGGSNNTQASVLPPYYGASAVYTTQDHPQRWAFCMYCQVNFQAEQPVDVLLPAKVTDNILKIGMYGYSPTKWVGWDKVAHGGHSAYVFLSGLQIKRDTTTAPRWEIGSYVPGMPGGGNYDSGAGIITGSGDNFNIPPSNGKTYSPLGAPQPGILQLYVRDWFSGVTDSVWTLISGPGVLSRAGLYTAPRTAQTACATVQAQSASQPAIRARQSICTMAVP